MAASTMRTWRSCTSRRTSVRRRFGERDVAESAGDAQVTLPALSILSWRTRSCASALRSRVGVALGRASVRSCPAPRVPTSQAHPLVGPFLTDRTLHVDHSDPRFAGVLRNGRPVLLDLADQRDLRELPGQWGGRVDVVRATIDEQPADALLIRPDALSLGRPRSTHPARAPCPH